MAFVMRTLFLIGALPTLLPANPTSTPDSHVLLSTGALLERQGNVLPVSKTVVMVLNLNIFQKLETQLQHIWAKSVILNGRMEIIRTNMARARPSAHHFDFLLELRGILDPVIERAVYDPSNRDKRSICDGCGNLMGWFAGLVTEQQLEGFGQRVRAAMNAQQEVIKKDLAQTKLVADKVNEVIGAIDNVTAWVNIEIAQRNTKFGLVMDNIRFTTIIGRARELVETLRNLALGLTLAAHGQIVPSLLPPAVLSKVLHEALEGNPGLRLLWDNVFLYYPVLKGALTREGLVISIPFMPTMQYVAHRVNAFPTRVDNQLIELTGHYVGKLILKSVEANNFALMTEEDFRSCIFEQDVYICQDIAVIERPIAITRCISHLMGLISDLAVHDCDFQVSDPDWVTHVAVRGHHFLYFPHAKSATVNCKGGSRPVSVEGPYVLPANCSLNVEDSIHIPAISHFTRHYPLLVSTITPLGEVFQYPNSTVPRSVAPLKLSDNHLGDLPDLSIHKHPLFFGTVGSYSVSFIIICGMVIFLCFFLKRSRGVTAVLMDSKPPERSAKVKTESQV